MAYVYLLKSLKDNKQYIGSTLNLVERLKRHNDGHVFSTKSRRPLVLLGYQLFETIAEASVWETKYKRSHGALDRAIRTGKFILSGD